MRDHQIHSPIVNVPDDLKVLEADFQRQMYVENRIFQCLALKHDRLMLKDRFLQALVPPDVQIGFSDEINRLQRCCDLYLSQIQSLTSQVEHPLQEQITVKDVKANDYPIDNREDYDWGPQQPNHRSSIWKMILVIIIVLVSYGIGRTHGVSCSPLSVDTDSVGATHSVKGGIANGQNDQPKQGPSPTSKGNRRLPKDLP